MKVKAKISMLFNIGPASAGDTVGDKLTLLSLLTRGQEYRGD